METGLTLRRSAVVDTKLELDQGSILFYSFFSVRLLVVSVRA